MTKIDEIMQQVETVELYIPGTISYHEEKAKLRAMIEDAMKAPDGWKLVPVEPDELIIQAGCLEHSDNYYKTYKKWADSHSSGIVNQLRNLVICGYKSMLLAAPECEVKP
jgi:hypothetical protein